MRVHLVGEHQIYDRFCPCRYIAAVIAGVMPAAADIQLLIGAVDRSDLGVALFMSEGAGPVGG